MALPNQQVKVAWALVGVQSILCTLSFLALLYLNFQIWRQYFFLILWAFVLSHAFKSTLDDVQKWSDHVAKKVSSIKTTRQNVLCILCSSACRYRNEVKWEQPPTRSTRSKRLDKKPGTLRTWWNMPLRFSSRVYRFAGSYGFYFLGSSYLFYWFVTYYVKRIQLEPTVLVWHCLWLSCGVVLPCAALFWFLGGTNIAHCLLCCCGSPSSKSSSSSLSSSSSKKKKKKRLTNSSTATTTTTSKTIRDLNKVNPCASKLLIIFTICSTCILSMIMSMHALYDVAYLGSVLYGEVNRSASEITQRLNYTEVEFRQKMNGILDAPLSSARDTYGNETWWCIVEDVWASVKRTEDVNQIWRNAHLKSTEVYSNETWWPYVDDYLHTVHEWIGPSSTEEARSRTAESSSSSREDKNQTTSYPNDIGTKDKVMDDDEADKEDKEDEECLSAEGSDTPKGTTCSLLLSPVQDSVEDEQDIHKMEQEKMEQMEQEDDTFASFVRDSLWVPFTKGYIFVAKNNNTLTNVWLLTRDVGGGILGTTISSLIFVLSTITSTISTLATITLFFLFLDTMLTNEVDELKIVVLLLYPAGQAGRTERTVEDRRVDVKIEKITNSLRHAFEGVLFVPLSLSSLYAAHQLFVMTILGKLSNSYTNTEYIY